MRRFLFQNTPLAIVLLVAGAALLAISVLANPLEIGNAQRFGYKQIAGTAVGAIAVLWGALVLARRRRAAP